MANTPDNSDPIQGTVATPLGVVDALRLLSDAALHRLCVTQNIQIDPAKRIDVPTQVARAIVAGAGPRRVDLFPSAERQLVRVLAERGGSMAFASPPAALASLLEKGILFSRRLPGGGVQVYLPIALLLQLPLWEGEDPSSVRALLTACAEAPASAIATHYLGRAATHPIRIALEPAWRALTDEEKIRGGLAELVPAERDLLAKIERLGGEVTTEELLDLEREPLRLRTATGVSQARRGIGFSLERRGFLIPLHPDRHVIPSEVLRVVGERQRTRRENERGALRDLALGETHEPLRAKYADDPTPLGLAFAMHLRHQPVPVKPGFGTPTSLVQRMATRFGADEERVLFLSALGRAVGLWDASADDPFLPPGSLRVGELDAQLVGAWLSGSAWNEALPAGESGRVPNAARLSGAVAQLRVIVVDALRELADDRWVELGVLEQYVLGEHRIRGLDRLITRWGGQQKAATLSVAQTVRRMLTASLHYLGCVDCAPASTDGRSADGRSESAPEQGLLRVTPTGRRLLHHVESKTATRPVRASSFDAKGSLQVGSDAGVAAVLSLSRFFDVGSVSGKVELLLSPAGVATASAAGIEPEALRAELASVALIPEQVQRMLAHASAVVGEATFAPAQGFLWVPDAEVRNLLSSRRSTQALFLHPSPEGGLLVASGVAVDVLVRRARALGVRVATDGTSISAQFEQVRSSESGTHPEVKTSESGTRPRVGTTKKPRRTRAG